MARKPKADSADNSAVKMVIPKHGNGQLLPGGQPGNRGGYGRPRSEIRKAAALAFDRRIPVLEAIADSTDGKDVDRTGAIRLMMQAGGIGTEPAIDRELIKELAEGLEAELPDDMDAVKQRIYERWAVTLGRYAAGEA